eukprot:1194880-Prorocentrum_minimum.AAC.2
MHLCCRMNPRVRLCILTLATASFLVRPRRAPVRVGFKARQSTDKCVLVQCSSWCDAVRELSHVMRPIGA